MHGEVDYVNQAEPRQMFIVRWPRLAWQVAISVSSRQCPCASTSTRAQSDVNKAY